MTVVTSYLSSHEVARAAGCTYRQLDYWVNQGILRPEHGRGSGNPRVWHEDDIVHARICTTLAKLGATTPVLVSAIRAVRNHPELLEGAWLTVTHEGSVVPVLTPHQAAWIVPLH